MLRKPLNSEKGQVPGGVGGLISLLVLVAVGALVLYEVTDPLAESTAVDDITVENSDSQSVDVSHGVDSATLTTEYSMDNAYDNYWVALNGENIVTLSGSGSDTIENDVTDRMVKGTNTLEATAESAGSADSDNATLETTTYGSSAVSNVESKGSTVLDLLTILAIVFTAALIIGVVIRSIGGFGGRSMR